MPRTQRRNMYRLQRQKESLPGHRFYKWADAGSVINIISIVYAYAQNILIRKLGGNEPIGDIVDGTGTEEGLREIMKTINVPPKLRSIGCSIGTASAI